VVARNITGYMDALKEGTREITDTVNAKVEIEGQVQSQ
jgi:hypothetical protein